jgi:hypothetical protein
MNFFTSLEVKEGAFTIIEKAGTKIVGLYCLGIIK